MQKVDMSEQTKNPIRWILPILVVGILVGGYVSRGSWRPKVEAWFDSTQTADADPHAGHDHSVNPFDDHPHDDETTLVLSEEAQQNIGLKTIQVSLQSFDQTIQVPAIVVEEPGKSLIQVTAPLGGQVTKIHVVRGQAITPGTPLFDLRLTHEELVKAQSDFLQAAEELDVVKAEIKRLKSASIPGAIAGKTIRVREYEQQKLEAAINAQSQSLVLHGLSKEQVDGIIRSRKLLQGLTVFAPQVLKDTNSNAQDNPLHIHSMDVNPGQYVQAGGRLCVIADHHRLLIEGNVFEEDTEHLTNAANKKWLISASNITGSKKSTVLNNLSIYYLSDVIEHESRAFHFYVQLPNKIVRDEQDSFGNRFVSWKYKPGQRMELRVPIERWKNRIVLPVDAVARDGANAFIFEKHGTHFDRKPVHVEYRGQDKIVIANDKKLVGKTIAASGARLMLLELKNKSAGPIDPHAGHSH